MVAGGGVDGDLSAAEALKAGDVNELVRRGVGGSEGDPGRSGEAGGLGIECLVLVGVGDGDGDV